jgi:eukaryotic-like serine/threonine-protein kinase
MELERAIWTLGDRIREGGMGSIYDGTSAEYGPAVAKLVPKAPGAERE